MKQTKDDRRSRRTRQLLGDALESLMREGRYDAITVQHILDRADVGRSTFYAHFYDKDDLLVYIIETMLARLSERIAQDGDPLLFGSLALFRHAAEYRSLYLTLKRGAKLEMLLATFQRYLTQDVERRLARTLRPAQAAEAPLAGVATFVAGSFLTLLRWWLDEAPEHSPEQMDALFRALVLPGLHHVLPLSA